MKSNSQKYEERLINYHDCRATLIKKIENSLNAMEQADIEKFTLASIKKWLKQLEFYRYCIERAHRELNNQLESLNVKLGGK